jgi:zinc transport system substrate-binding protein
MLALLFPAAAMAKLKVAVTIPAQAWLVERIAGAQAELVVMIPEGHVAESARPHPRLLGEFQQAVVRLIVGHPSLFFEARYLKPQQDKADYAVWINMYDIGRSIWPGDELGLSDPHLWTSPAIMLATAEKLAEVLSELDSENRHVYQQNLAALQQDIGSLDRQIRKISSTRENRELLVYHPAWGSFCRDYGLQQHAIESEGKEPGPANLSRLLKTVDSRVGFIISSPGSDERIASMIASELAIRLVLIDPMSHDWKEMMHAMKTALESRK